MTLRFASTGAFILVVLDQLMLLTKLVEVMVSFLRELRSPSLYTSYPAHFC
jgi:hypothetical protein